MAINLPLVLGQKVTGQRMEKYYVFGTSFVSLISTVIPWASGVLGWDAANQALGYLIAYEFGSYYYRSSTQLNSNSSASSPHPGSTILKFRNIVVRIALYPLVSCFLNISGASLDLHQWKHPEQTDLNMALNLADLAVYAARPLIYGLLAATDPSFIRALVELRNGVSAHSNHPNSIQRTDACFTTALELASESEHEIFGHSQAEDLHQEEETGPSQREMKDIVSQI
ncbi:hypothetical protein MSAN_02137200 [Mycena sanguinolenta]|nr:hypothetical protein MSAN_02137200 [Mycena sanguinolenta]